MIGPSVAEWPDGTIAWCQRCDRPIRLGQRYTTIDWRGSAREGFRHRLCLVRNTPTP